MYKYKIFCCAESGEDSICGELISILPLKPGHSHVIKDRIWQCEWVDKNANGEPLANFRLQNYAKKSNQVS
jgi:hypothetical protein